MTQPPVSARKAGVGKMITSLLLHLGAALCLIGADANKHHPRTKVFKLRAVLTIIALLTAFFKKELGAKGDVSASV